MFFTVLSTTYFPYHLFTVSSIAVVVAVLHLRHWMDSYEYFSLRPDRVFGENILALTKTNVNTLN
jgi:hypothetical protein